SCTNTSNPAVLVGAGLVAKRARELGLETKPWVKTSLAPGSQVVSDYLEESGLQSELNALGFHLVGYGCTTCIGNSGPLKDPVTQAVTDGDLTVCAVLSGNRNFEGRVHPLVKANYLASPMLVVAYAIAGSMKVDLYHDAIGTDKNGNPAYLKDIWPSNAEIETVLEACLKPEMFAERYGNVFKGSSDWQGITAGDGDTYQWDSTSTYVQRPPFFEDMEEKPSAITDIKGARILALLGDSITTDHISPAGSFTDTTPAGIYLQERQVARRDFNSYGSRRGNHQIMMRGTFANIRIRNEMVQGVEGGFTKLDGKELPIFEAAMKLKEQNIPAIVIGGKEYGTGSSRDWAAKGTKLLGIAAVIAESFERIHRSNLIGMGVLPLQFPNNISRKTLELTGEEIIDIAGISGDTDGLEPKKILPVTITYRDGRREMIEVLCRIDTLDELDYYRHGGILHYVLRDLRNAA
ncbi:MAG: aconitate hydratase AcnA, partial [Pseudomonadota bacterium]